MAVTSLESLIAANGGKTVEMLRNSQNDTEPCR